jgi:hypothetical protein
MMAVKRGVRSLTNSRENQGVPLKGLATFKVIYADQHTRENLIVISGRRFEHAISLSRRSPQAVSPAVVTRALPRLSFVK